MAELTARIEVPGTLISDYVLRRPENPRSLVILLHGYRLTGDFIYKQFSPGLPEDAVVLAPNGPYPVPDRKPDGSFRAGFSWYFFNPATPDRYFIDMENSIRLLEGMVNQLGLGDLPKTIVGYSQGGYLAPFVAARLSRVEQVVGVASEFLYEEMKGSLPHWPPSYRMDSIHGERDEVVSFESSKENHSRLSADGVRGEFKALKDVGHLIESAIRDAVRSAVRKQ
jgi:predicted esterase